METEIEAKFPDVDIQEIRKKLKEVGAVLEYPEILMRRKVFDYSSVNKMVGWVRVRDEGNKITLSYKQLENRTLHGTKEVVVVVDDFEKTCSFLFAIGLEEKSYQETKRERWRYDDVEITIDTWPWIPTFVEIEGMSEESVKKAANILGLDWKNALYGSVEPVYQMHYNVSDVEINNWKSITFVQIPDWLLIKKKPM